MIRNAILAFSALGVMGAAPAMAQVIDTGVPAGSPQSGVEVQYRYSNPSDSRALLQAAPAPQQSQQGGATTNNAGAGAARNANPFPEALARRAAARGGEGGEGAERQPFVNQEVGALQRAGSSQAEDHVVLGSDIYRGIAPNDQDTLPHLRRIQQRAQQQTNELTWIGFQPFEDRTRVFLQTGRASNHSVTVAPDGTSVTVSMPQTRISVRNFRRPLEAGYFGRVVGRIQASSVGGDTASVQIQLARPVRHEITQGRGSSGEHYLFVDFFDTVSEGQ